jgi:hypothetical protein
LLPVSLPLLLTFELAHFLEPLRPLTITWLIVLVVASASFLLLLGWKIWALVAIWRCAPNCSVAVWKFVARAYVILFVLSVALSAIQKFAEYRSREYEPPVKSDLFVTSPANAQWLWGVIKYGMSLEQVKTLVPNGTPASEPDYLADGSQELLRLENVKIVNTNFSAKFYFKTGKLSQVTLEWETGQTFESALLVFNSLTEAFRTKYGSEISREVKRDRAEVTWVSGQTNINVIAISGGETNAILNVNYQLRVARDADKP